MNKPKILHEKLEEATAHLDRLRQEDAEDKHMCQLAQALNKHTRWCKWCAKLRNERG